MAREVTAVVVIPLLPPLFDKVLMTLRLNKTAQNEAYPGYFQFPTLEINPDRDSENGAKEAIAKFLGLKMSSDRILYFGESPQVEFINGSLLKYHQFGYMMKVGERPKAPPVGFSTWYEWPVEWCLLRESLLMPLQSRIAELVSALTQTSWFNDMPHFKSCSLNRNFKK